MENTEGLFLKAGSSIICWNMFNDAQSIDNIVNQTAWRVLRWN